MTFKKNDIVRCIDDGGSRHLTKGRLYVVAKDSSGGWLRLKEDNRAAGTERKWYAYRFEKAQPVPARDLRSGDTVVRIDAEGGGDSVTVGDIATVDYVERAYGDNLVTFTTRSGATHNLYDYRFALLHRPEATQAAPAPTPVPPAGPSKIDLKSLKAGDKITATVTMVVKNPVDFEGDVEVFLAGDPAGTGYSFYLTEKQDLQGTVEKAKPPIKVGDKVMLKGGSWAYTVLCLDTGKAWLKDSRGDCMTYLVSNLEHAD
ncbi:hypothetical protein EOE18_14725 [Novosphingobium umbonatum]|uniref:Uncharacterized protein n=1 Tax=Novosphingobium umbonatum TaxID=1908524 RepID=A0A437N0Y4_9SPHN|nr:hypothetical protein [Novosphingobium umbonatum]RVU03574.1 hypothetical protein EOE18_14725 [Novosphingobium umbonatum]